MSFTSDIYTLYLHDALPISLVCMWRILWRVWPARIGGVQYLFVGRPFRNRNTRRCCPGGAPGERIRSEEHTSELQSRLHLVCRLLLEKKNKNEPCCLTARIH